MRKAQKNNQDFPTLIKRFEEDIIYDAHSLIAKFERSDAQKELFQRGRESLRPIIDHIKDQEHFSKFQVIGNDLDIAWGKLLNRFEILLDPKKTAPEDLRDITGWITWAERFAT